MGLFGLFATMFGLGAMAKDAISDEIDDVKSSKKAKMNGSPYYYSHGGRIKSTETGKYVRRDTDWRTGEEWLVDDQTKERIANMTDLRKQNANEKEIMIAKRNGSIFYRIHDYDIYKGGIVDCRADIYKCLTMPGYFKKVDRTTPNDYVYYIQGDLGDDSIKTYGVHINGVYVSKPMKGVITTIDSRKYFEDGTPYTKEEVNRRNLEKVRESARRRGEHFYKVDYQDHYRSVETNKPYIYNKKDQSFSPAQIVEKTYEVRIPHHEATTIKTEISWEVIPDGQKMNMDGTRWIE